MCLLLLLHRLLVLRYQLRLRMPRHRCVVRKFDGARPLPDSRHLDRYSQSFSVSAAPYCVGSCDIDLRSLRIPPELRRTEQG
jgi:hypothetical protein